MLMHPDPYICSFSNFYGNPLCDQHAWKCRRDKPNAFQEIFCTQDTHGSKGQEKQVSRRYIRRWIAQSSCIWRVPDELGCFGSQGDPVDLPLPGLGGLRSCLGWTHPSEAWPAYDNCGWPGETPLCHEQHPIISSRARSTGSSAQSCRWLAEAGSPPGGLEGQGEARRGDERAGLVNSTTSRTALASPLQHRGTTWPRHLLSPHQEAKARRCT